MGNLYFATVLLSSKPALRNYEPLFWILYELRLNGEQRYWIERREAVGNICGVEVFTRQMATEVKIAFLMPHNVLTTVEEYVQ